jgi:hypothetical protein
MSTDPCRFKNFRHDFTVPFPEVSLIYECHLATNPVHIFCILRFIPFPCYIFPSFCVTFLLFVYSHIDINFTVWHSSDVSISSYSVMYCLLCCKVLIFKLRCWISFFQVFSFFNVIRFRNNQCTGGNGQIGTCYSRKECTNLGGIASGSCARNWGTCCVSKCAMNLRLCSC